MAALSAFQDYYRRILRYGPWPARALSSCRA